jgi:lysophospholipase L1-like esterase
MLTVYKIALAPALLLQGLHLRKTALRLPEAEGPRSGTAGTGTVDPLRVLFVGDSSAAGVGVDWQHEAMPHQAAEFIAAALQRPVCWQLIARSGVNTREAVDLFQAQRAEPADVVVTALGVNDVTAQRSAMRFIADYAELLGRVRERTGAQWAVISGLPSMHLLPAVPQPLRWYLGQCAARLDGSLRRFCASDDQRRFISLRWAETQEMARDRFHPGRAQYRHWAELVAGQVVGLVQSSPSLQPTASGSC